LSQLAPQEKIHNSAPLKHSTDLRQTGFLAQGPIGTAKAPLDSRSRLPVGDLRPGFAVGLGYRLNLMVADSTC